MGQPTLDHEQFPLRLYALARAGPNELREWQPRWSELPLWPLVWSLRRAGWLEGSSAPVRLARIWQRWGPSHRAAHRHSRHECCNGILDSLTWEARLTWVLLLLEGHRERAIDPLLELLRQGDEKTRQLVALGLAQLGRQILPDLRERWRSAGHGEKQAICQILWYLGPQARGCLDWLQGFQDGWARAVFYAMEEHGWSALLAGEYAPLWLDDRSLEHIAGLAFSVQESHRERALAALRGWGPAAVQAQSLLEALVRDPIRTLGLEALQLLLDQNAHLSVKTLQFALLYAGGRCRTAAVRQLLADFPAWSKAYELTSDGVVSSLAQQNVLVLSLELWGQDWLDQVCEHLTRHGLCDPEAAKRLLPLRSQEALTAYFRLGGDNFPLRGIAREGPLETARLIFQKWWQDQHWQGLFACLHRPEFLQIILHQDILGDLLRKREFAQVTQLVHALRNLEERGEPELARWTAEVLRKVDLTALDWRDWSQLSPEARELRQLVMEWRGQVPDGIVQAVREGKQLNRGILEKIVVYREDAQEVLLEGLHSCSASARQDLLEALRSFGLPAWRALLELQQSRENLDDQLGPELSRQLHLVEVQHFLLDRGPGGFVRLLPWQVRVAMSEAMLGCKAPPDDRRWAWAQQLAFFPESARCALHYLVRAYGQEGRGLLEQAMAHPDVGVRYQALVTARLCCSDWIEILRSRAPDADPNNLLRTLEWLSEKDQLTPAEWRLAEQLKNLPGTSYGARNLLEGKSPPQSSP